MAAYTVTDPGVKERKRDREIAWKAILAV